MIFARLQGRCWQLFVYRINGLRVLVFCTAEITFASTGLADKHGIPRADAVHAVRNPLIWVRDFDEPRIDGPRPHLFIGHDRSGENLREVMGNWLTSGDLELFHLMHLREKTRERVRTSQ